MFSQIHTFLDLLGYPSTVIVVISAVAAVYLAVKGVLPALWRLGYGLAARKIAIFATSAGAAQSLEALLLDSRLFARSNIIRVTAHGDVGRAKAATLFVVYWPDWQDRIDEVLQAKADGTALIVYAPHAGGEIPREVMARLDSRRHVIVNRFRGRLLNDVVSSMITTSYEKS